MRLVPLLALVASLVFSADAGGRAVAEPPAELFVFPFDTTLGARAETDVDLSLPATSTVTAVTEQAPAGVALRLDAPPGLSLGTATLSFAGDPAPMSAELLAADPAAFATDPCAPGVHAAVWTAMRLTVFLDRDPTGATTLRFCPPQTAGKIVDVDLDLLGAVTNAATAGVLTWRAFVTPTTGAPFEVRSLVALPQSLGFRASYTAGSIRLRGRLTAAGSSRPVINVHLALATRADLADARELGVARTRTDGSWSLTRSLARSRTAQHVTLIAYVNFYVGACADPPLVPGGCAEQTVAPPPPELLALTVPRRASARTG